jgi:hypothetical protein
MEVLIMERNDTFSLAFPRDEYYYFLYRGKGSLGYDAQNDKYNRWDRNFELDCNDINDLNKRGYIQSYKLLIHIMRLLGQKKNNTEIKELLLFGFWGIEGNNIVNIVNSDAVTIDDLCEINECCNRLYPVENFRGFIGLVWLFFKMQNCDETLINEETKKMATKGFMAFLDSTKNNQYDISFLSEKPQLYTSGYEWKYNTFEKNELISPYYDVLIKLYNTLEESSAEKLNTFCEEFAQELINIYNKSQAGNTFQKK